MRDRSYVRHRNRPQHDRTNSAHRGWFVERRLRRQARLHEAETDLVIKLPAPRPMPDRHLPTHLTRRDHAVARVSGLQKLDELEARGSEAWILEHIPLDTPATLLQRRCCCRFSFGERVPHRLLSGLLVHRHQRKRALPATEIARSAIGVSAFSHSQTSDEDCAGRAERSVVPRPTSLLAGRSS